MRTAWFALTAAALAACSSETFEPPTRTPDIAAEERRVAALLEQPARGAGPVARGGCSVRILGIDRTTTYAWRNCEFRDPSGVSSGVSGPVRVDGTVVRSPADGAGYDDSIRELFPVEMTDAILEHRSRLQPDRP